MLENSKWLNGDFITLNEARKGGRDLSLILEIIKFAILVWVIHYGVDHWIYGLVEELIPTTTATDGLLLFLYSNIFLIVIYIVLIKVIEKRNLRSIGFSKDNLLPSYIKGIICGFLMFSGVVVIGCLTGQYKFNGFSSSMGLILVPFFIGFMIAAMKEDVFSRGWIFVSISRKNSVILAMIISSLSFVSVHLLNDGLNLISIINIALVGILFCVMFLRMDNIWFCSAVHAVWNFTQGCFFGFEVSGFNGFPSVFSFSMNNFSIIGGNEFGPEASLIATAVLLITLIIFVYYPKSSSK